MNLSARIKQYLDSHKVSPHVFCHPPTVTLTEAGEMLSISPEQILRSVLLSDGHGYLLVVLSLSRKIDFALLKSVTRRDYKIVPRSIADRLFMDCEPGSHPPLGEAYKIPVMVDRSVSTLKNVYFEPGAHTCLVRMHQSEFHYLLADAPWERFSVPMEDRDSVSSHWARQPDLLVPLQLSIRPDLEAVGRNILSTYKVPAPNQSLLGLQNQPFEETKVGLSSFLDGHPNLCLLLSRYKITTTEINEWQEDPMGCAQLDRLLFIVTVVDLMEQFQFNQKGPISRDNLIHHSLISGLLFEQLAIQHLTSSINPFIALKVGLCQNLGLFLIGQLFSPEYQMLSKMVLFNPKTPITILEKRLVGMGKAQQVIKKGHSLVGAWLITHWQIMPEEVSLVTTEHHNLYYEGPMSEYIRLLVPLNALLRAQTGLGDGVHVQAINKQLSHLEEQGLHLEQWTKDWLNTHQDCLLIPLS